MERNIIRRKIIADRNQLTSQDLEIKSKLIIENLFNLAEFKTATTVLFYASFKSEVQTMAAIEKGITMGLRIALPRTLASEKQLIPYLINDPKQDLKPGYCSIPEPDPVSTIPLAPQEIDLVIIPGSVFDQNGGRLGYGGGFYDRFLTNQAPAASRIALAFDLQVVDDNLPLESHDQPIDWLVTEKNIFRFDQTER